jgi:hypothetical protein
MMTPKILAIAATTAALMAYGSAAQACISCSYTPEVAKGGSSTSEAAPPRRERSYTEEKRERPSRAAKKLSTRESDSDAKETAKEAKAAVAAPQKDEASNEPSAITTTGAAIANQVKAAVATPEKTGPQNENSTISTATTTTSKPIETKGIEQVTADKNIGCKKYFPSTGLTLSVPCE